MPYAVLSPAQKTGGLIDVKTTSSQGCASLRPGPHSGRPPKKRRAFRQGCRSAVRLELMPRPGHQGHEKPVRRLTKLRRAPEISANLDSSDVHVYVDDNPSWDRNFPAPPCHNRPLPSATTAHRPFHSTLETRHSTFPPPTATPAARSILSAMLSLSE